MMETKKGYIYLGDDVRFFMGNAWDAASRSPDPSSQNGACLVNRGYTERFKTGCNHFPDGTLVTPELLGDRDAKLAKIVHAEVDCIVECARCGVSTDGATMYCLWAACSRCAGVIVQAGIKRLVRHEWYSNESPERWRRDIESGDEVLRDGGVEIVQYGGPVDSGAVLRFDGKPVTASMVSPLTTSEHYSREIVEIDYPVT